MFKKFLNDTAGNFSMMMAGGVLALIGGIGLSVDYMAMTDISAELQAATDRAALIAAQSSGLSEAERIEAANSSFQNLEGSLGEISTSYGFDDDIITVASQVNYRPIIMGILGHGSQTIRTSAQTPNVEFSGVDISLVLDVTGSMNCLLYTSPSPRDRG